MELIHTGKLTNKELNSILSEKQSYDRKLHLASIYNNFETKYDDSVRSGKIKFLEIQEAKKTFNILQSIVIEKFFSIDVDFDFSNVSNLQFTRYEVGEKFIWHQDVINTGEFVRCLTMSVNISDESSYTGGELLLKHNSQILTLDKQIGSYIIFPSFLRHQASEVLSGVRESMVVWFMSSPNNLNKLKKLYAEKYQSN